MLNNLPRAALGSQLDQLEYSELVRRLSEEELSYIFKHALVQDTAYQSLLKQDRRELHRVVGEAIEGVFPGQLDENAARLSQHFAEAGDCDKAIAYARQAARRALARYAFEEAVRQLETALTLVETEKINDLQLTLIEETADANRLLRQGERTLALYQQAIDLWSQRESAARLNIVRLYSKIIQAVVDFKWTTGVEFMHQADEMGNAARASLEAELKLMSAALPQTEIAQALTALSLSAWRLQAVPDWDAAENFALAAVAMAEQLPNSEILSHALDALASVCDGRGRLRDHLEVAQRRLMVTQRAGFDDRREKIDALRGVGMAQMYLGEYAQALPSLREAENSAEGIQAIELYTFATGLQAHCLFRLDRWDEVLEIEKKWRALERQYARERVGVT